MLLPQVPPLAALFAIHKIRFLCSLLSREPHFTFSAPSILLGMQRNRLLCSHFSLWHRQGFGSRTLFKHQPLSAAPQDPIFLNPSYRVRFMHFVPFHANFLGRIHVVIQELKQAWLCTPGSNPLLSC